MVRMIEKKYPGLFVVLEGIDGAGTTTQMSLLKKELENGGRQVHLTREPSDQLIGRMIRQDLGHKLQDDSGQQINLNNETVALLFAADRLHHYSAEIMPALMAGKVVISDRYYGSSAVYQGPLCGADWVKQINSRAAAPDLILYFSLPPDVASARRKQRGGTVERFEDDTFLTTVAARYDALYENDELVVTIDATQGIEELTKACLKPINDLLTGE